MPPKKKAAAPAAKKAQTLSDLVDSASDGEDADMQVVEKAPPKRKPAPKKPAAAKPAAKGRKKKEPEPESGSGEDDDEDAEEEVEKPKPAAKKAPAKPRARATKKVDANEDKEEATAKSKPKPAAKGRKKAAPEPESEEEESGSEEDDEDDDDDEEEEEAPPPPPKAKAAAAKKTAAAKKPPAERKKRLTKKEQEALAAKEAAEKKDEIAETQVEAMDVDSADEGGPAGSMEIAPTPTQVHSGNAAKPVAKKPAAKGRGKKVDAIDEIAESQQVKEEEDDLTGGAVLGRGRKVNGNTADGKAYKDLEKKYRALEQRFTKLKDLKESEAEKSLAKFKKNMDERAENADKLIASLQDDLNAQSSLAGESKALKKKLQAKDAEITKLQAKIHEQIKNIQDQQKEHQVLSAKLAVAQTQKTVPGSAVKAGAVGRGVVPPNRVVSGSDEPWATRVKEELYSDMTGLLILSVKKEPEGKLFECIQTGTNGALHFKLSVPEPKDPSAKAKNNKAPSSSQAENKDEDDEREENEYAFIPVLDRERDKVVISLLPAYLQDEIVFNKDHAARFYQKINGILTQTPRAPEGEETEEETEEDDDGEEEGVQEESVQEEESTMVDVE